MLAIAALLATASPLTVTIAVLAVVAVVYTVRWYVWFSQFGHDYLVKLKPTGWVNLPGVGMLLSMLMETNFRLVDRTSYEDLIPSFFDKFGKGRGYLSLILGPMPLFFVINPELIKKVIGNPVHNKKPNEYALVFGRVFGDGLVTSHGHKWKMDRAAITPSFHFDALKGYAETMNKQCDIMVGILAKVPHGKVCADVGRVTTLCAFDIIMETALGMDMNGQTTENPHVDAFQEITEAATERFVYPWLQNDTFFYNVTPSGRAITAFLHNLNKLTKSIIDNRRLAIAENPDIVNNGKRKSFLDIILTEVRSDGSTFSDKDLFEQVNTFIGAGHDTTGSSTIWCLQLLGHHQAIQQKLYEEIDEVIGSEGYVSVEHLGNMKYLDMVVKEGLRIYPGVPMFARELEADVEHDGYIIKKGTYVTVMTLAMQRSKDVWGPDADKFDPERWTPEREAGRHPYSFLPFSAGSRNCIGQKYALQEEKIMLIKILQKFRVESVKDKVPSHMQIVLNPVGGVPLRIFHRDQEQ